MAKMQAMICENCAAELGELDEAFVWLDRPVCKKCFRHLASTHSVKYRGLWMPLAIVAVVISVGLAVSLVMTLSRPSAPTANRVPKATGSAAKSANGAELQKLLAGTKWEWGADSFTLLDDGTVDQPEWKERGLDTRWTAFDERTVVFFIAKGRDNNLYADLRFNDELTQWNGTNFEGGHMANNHRISK